MVCQHPASSWEEDYEPSIPAFDANTDVCPGQGMGWEGGDDELSEVFLPIQQGEKCNLSRGEPSARRCTKEGVESA